MGQDKRYDRHNHVALETLPSLVRQLLDQDYSHLYITISLDKEEARVEAWKYGRQGRRT
jgi:hypothetical protein